MRIEEMLLEGRKIWPEKMTLKDIAICLTVITGDVARCARGALKDELKEDVGKELGNLVLSSLRWMQDLGLAPERCLEKALEAQRVYAAEEKPGEAHETRVEHGRYAGYLAGCRCAPCCEAKASYERGRLPART